jgi:hypothetical protein
VAVGRPTHSAPIAPWATPRRHNELRSVRVMHWTTQERWDMKRVVTWSAMAVVTLALQASGQTLENGRCLITTPADQLWAARVARRLGGQGSRVERTSFDWTDEAGRSARARVTTAFVGDLRVERYSIGAAASTFASIHPRAVGSGAADTRVTEVRGGEVVIVSGPGLSDPARARRALAAAWVDRSTAGPPALTLVSQGTNQFAGISRGPSPVARSAEHILTQSRAHEDATVRRPSIRLRWLNADRTAVQVDGPRFAATVVVADGVTRAALAPDAAAATGLRRYLEALGAPPPPSGAGAPASSTTVGMSGRLRSATR